MSKKKVLHIIQNFGGGGAETWLLATVKYLQEHPELNLHFDFLAAGGNEGIFDEEIKSAGSNIFYLKYSFQNIFRFRRQFTSILKEHKYDVIHDHQDFVSGWHFLLGLGFLPSLRVTHLHNPYNFVHNYLVSKGRWISFRLGRLLTVLLTTKITATSDAVMDEYGYDKWPYKNKRVPPTYCGFDTNRFSYSPDDKSSLTHELKWDKKSKIALFLGRIGLQKCDSAKNQKNPEFAFKLCKMLVAQYNWKFLFVGLKGVLGTEMEEEIQKMGLSGSVKFLDFRRDVPQIMSPVDILVFPSFWEGLGMVAVEAQACGLKVIASDTIPREAIITDLVLTKSLNDNLDAWTNAIVQFTSTQVERERYLNIIFKSPFSIENSVARLLSLYNLKA